MYLRSIRDSAAGSVMPSIYPEVQLYAFDWWGSDTPWGAVKAEEYLFILKA